MKKILYIIHTDWGWIKQRSQFLAEELQEHFTVDIRFKLSPKRKKLVRNAKTASCKGLPFLPFVLYKYKLLRILDKIVYSCYFLLLNKIKKYDAIIITHPLLFNYVNGLGKIIFDMHDDNAAFYDNHFLQRVIFDENVEALNNSTAVVFSSNYLYINYGNSVKAKKVIRNGHNGSRIAAYPHANNMKVNDKKQIFYFGTISKWFDFDLLLASLDRFKEIEYHIIGPNDIELPKHKRIIYHGTLGHDELHNACLCADAFIMPFHVTPLIEGVDPVKLYEYISFRKPIIVPEYEEIKYFSSFSYTYKNNNEYLSLINILINNKLTTKGKDITEQFLQTSTWKSRALEMSTFINSL